MSLKIQNKKGKVIARLEDDFSEPEILEEEDGKCDEECEQCKCKKTSEEVEKESK